MAAGTPLKGFYLAPQGAVTLWLIITHLYFLPQINLGDFFPHSWKKTPNQTEKARKKCPKCPLLPTSATQTKCFFFQNCWYYHCIWFSSFTLLLSYHIYISFVVCGILFKVFKDSIFL